MSNYNFEKKSIRKPARVPSRNRKLVSPDQVTASRIHATVTLHHPLEYLLYKCNLIFRALSAPCSRNEESSRDFCESCKCSIIRSVHRSFIFREYYTGPPRTRDY